MGGIICPTGIRLTDLPKSGGEWPLAPPVSPVLKVTTFFLLVNLEHCDEVVTFATKKKLNCKLYNSRGVINESTSDLFCRDNLSAIYSLRISSLNLNIRDFVIIKKQ